MATVTTEDRIHTGLRLSVMRHHVNAITLQRKTGFIRDCDFSPCKSLSLVGLLQRKTGFIRDCDTRFGFSPTSLKELQRKTGFIRDCDLIFFGDFGQLIGYNGRPDSYGIATGPNNPSSKVDDVTTEDRIHTGLRQPIRRALARCARLQRKTGFIRDCDEKPVHTIFPTSVTTEDRIHTGLRLTGDIVFVLDQLLQRKTGFIRDCDSSRAEYRAARACYNGRPDSYGIATQFHRYPQFHQFYQWKLKTGLLRD